MRFSSYINNQRCLEWGLNTNQGALFDLLNQAASWANEVIIDGTVFYWVSRNEVIRELPLFYAKPDTVYRHFVDLDKKELIEYRKVDGKDLIRLTIKGKTWNEFNSEINPNQLGLKSEIARIQIRQIIILIIKILVIIIILRRSKLRLAVGLTNFLMMI